MRIAIVSDYYYPQLGGITEHVHGQASELARRGHEVTVVTGRLLRAQRSGNGERPEPTAFELLELGTRAYPFYVNGSQTLQTIGPGLIAELDRLYRARSFEVVHVHNPFGVMLPISAIMRSRAPVTVATLHSVVPPGYRLLRLFQRPLGRVLRRLDARIAVSEAVIHSLAPFLPGFGFDVVPNGVDTDFFSPAAAPIPRLLDGKRNIVFVGRFDPRNGLKHMLRAFVCLRRLRDDVRLIVLGDGPLRPVYRRLVPAGLRDDVLFEGRVNRQRPRYLASAEVVCTPCTLASFGMVLLEGMSCGLPVVASRNSGFQIVMEDGVHGLMVDRASDARGFASALDRLLSDPRTARAMGAAGRAHVVGTYAWPLVVDQLEELYERLRR